MPIDLLHERFWGLRHQRSPALQAHLWSSMYCKLMRDVIRREVCRVGFDQRNLKPETRNRLLKLVSNCETRNPKPETDSEDLTSPGPFETRNPKPETDSEDLYLPQDRSKPETRNRLLKLVSNRETGNPKPTVKVGFELRNPKPETRNRLWRLNFPRTDLI